MFWWAVTVTAAVLTTTVGIQAIAKHQIRAVILGDNRPRIIRLIQGGNFGKCREILRVMFQMFQIEGGVDSAKPIGRSQP